MHRTLSKVAVPLSLAATLALATGAGNVFADTSAHAMVSGHVQWTSKIKDRVRINGHVFAVAPGLLGLFTKIKAGSQDVFKLNDHKQIVGVIHAEGNRKTGTITAISPTSISLGTTSYTVISGAPIHYRGYILTSAQVPINTLATVQLDSAGAVEAIWLHSDSNLPAKPQVSGTIQAVSSTSIEVSGHTLPVASNVVVRADGQNESYATLAPNQKVMVRLDQEGSVDFIQLQGQGTVRGSVAGDTTSSITIGSTTYPYAANAKIHYRKYSLSPTQVSTGSNAVIRLNALGQAVSVTLKSDAALPSKEKVSGTISAVSGNTITLSGYTLTMAPSFNLRFNGVSSLSDSVTAGETASASLNSAGQVSQLVIGTSAKGN